MSAAKLYLLDTSALMALIEDESGAERVQQVFARHPTLLSAISLLEVRYLTLRERDLAEANLRHALLKRSGADILWDLDEPTLLTAARLKAAYPLSIADALIAACALRHGAVLLHKDPEFEALAGEVELEPLPYKPATR